LAEKPILFVTDTCPVCNDTKAMLAPEIELGKIELVEASTPKAKDIVRQVPIKEVPECIVMVNGKYQRCDIEKLMDDAVNGRL